MSRMIFPPKRASSEVTLVFNFHDQLFQGELLDYAEVSASLYSGGPTPSLSVSNQDIFQDGSVYIQASGGTVGDIYTVTCSVQTRVTELSFTNSQFLVLSGYLAIIPDVP